MLSTSLVGAQDKLVRSNELVRDLTAAVLEKSNALEAAEHALATEKQRARAQIERLESELSGARSERQLKLARVKDRAHAALQRMEDELVRVRASLEASVGEGKQLKSALEEAEAEGRQLKAAVDEGRRRLSAAEDDAASLRHARDTTTARVRSLEEERARLSARAEDAESELESQRQARAAMATEMKSLSESFRGQIAHWKAECVSLTERYDAELERARAEGDGESERLRGTVTELQDSLAESTALVSRYGADLGVAVAQLKASEEAKHDVEAAVARLEGERAEIALKLDALEVQQRMALEQDAAEARDKSGELGRLHLAFTTSTTSLVRAFVPALSRLEEMTWALGGNQSSLCANLARDDDAGGADEGADSVQQLADTLAKARESVSEALELHSSEAQVDGGDRQLAAARADASLTLMSSLASAMESITGGRVDGGLLQVLVDRFVAALEHKPSGGGNNQEDRSGAPSAADATAAANAAAAKALASLEAVERERDDLRIALERLRVSAAAAEKEVCANCFCLNQRSLPSRSERADAFAQLPFFMYLFVPWVRTGLACAYARLVSVCLRGACSQMRSMLAASSWSRGRIG